MRFIKKNAFAMIANVVNSGTASGLREMMNCTACDNYLPKRCDIAELHCTPTTRDNLTRLQGQQY